jgi:hypothetical protein
MGFGITAIFDVWINAIGSLEIFDVWMNAIGSLQILMFG